MEDGRAADRGHHDADGVGLLEGRGAGVLPRVALLRLPRLIEYLEIFFIVKNMFTLTMLSLNSSVESLMGPCAQPCG